MKNSVPPELCDWHFQIHGCHCDCLDLWGKAQLWEIVGQEGKIKSVFTEMVSKQGYLEN